MTIRDVGLAVVHRAPWLEHFGRWAYARLPGFLHDTPTSRLRAHFANERRVTFVQIGAHDGVAGDPIRPIIIENDGWRGVMIEPQRDAFDRLKWNYRAQAQRLQFLNAAISEGLGEERLFSISEGERARLDLPEWSTQVASFNQEHVRRHFPQARLASTSVKTLPFSAAAELLPEGHVDVVVIDVEGHEAIIIEAIDLERHRVRFIIYEHKHLSECDRSVVARKLRAHGFALKAFGRDAIAFRRLRAVDKSGGSRAG